MRIESSVTAITWLPFAALDRLPELPIGIAVAHYDEPPGEVLGDLDAWRDADRFREANRLQGWIEVENGEIVDYGRDGRSVVTGAGLDRGAWGSTDSARPVGSDGSRAEPGAKAPVRAADRWKGSGGTGRFPQLESSAGIASDALDASQIAFPALEFPVIRPAPEVGRGFVRLQQTVGGRIGLPVPRALRGRGYFHIGSAQAWTTLELVIRADGSSDGRLVAASPFPHHSVYDSAGTFVTEQGLTDFDGWYREGHDDSPWNGDELEDELDRIAVRSGARLRRRRLDRGETLVEQGEPGAEMYLLLDGVLDVEIDGEPVAGIGSGAVLGELAVLGDGRRTATLRASRPSRVAVLAPTHRLAELALARRQADRL